MTEIKLSEKRFPNDKATIDWLDTYAPRTQETYIIAWKYFLRFTGMTGDGILSDRKNDKDHQWEKTVLRFKQWMNERKTENWAYTCQAIVRSFFAFHYTPLKYRRTEKRRLAKRRNETEDYQFSRDELKRMADVSDLMEKYVLTVGKSFGLRAGDFVTLNRGDVEPYLNREVPISIGKFATEKEEVDAYPFIDNDALPVIKNMIDYMTQQGRIKPTEKILTVNPRQLSRIIRRITKRAAINYGSKRVRFHCLRKFLCDRLASVMSESKWKQVIGKSIGERAYISPRSLREDYTKVMTETCWSQLETIDKKIHLEAIKMEAMRRGVTKEQIIEYFGLQQCRTLDHKIDALEQWLEEHRPVVPIIDVEESENTKEDCQKIISENELDDYLSRGWKFIATLPNGKIVVDNNNH